MRRILVASAPGQSGVEPVPALRKHYGADPVVASDLRAVASQSFAAGGANVSTACGRARSGCSVSSGIKTGSPVIAPICDFS